MKICFTVVFIFLLSNTVCDLLNVMFQIYFQKYVVFIYCIVVISTSTCYM